MGTLGKSKAITIGADKDFERGETDVFEVPVEGEGLGELVRVYLGKQQNSLTELSGGWFVDEVRVEGPGGEEWKFPCHAWFGASDTGEVSGDLERNLIPETEHQCEELEPAPVSVRAYGMAIPAPDKVKEGVKGKSKKGFGFGGEDAFFLTEGRNKIFGAGVADGIYQWREQGIDSGLFSQQLMKTAKNMVLCGYNDVFKIMYHMDRKNAAEGVYGSSTACLMSVDRGQARVMVANLGDSGLALIGATPSNPEVHVKYRTVQQEHFFGYPFQLGHHDEADCPESALLATLQAAPGDVVVLGSDGLWDNVFDSEVLEAVLVARRNNSPPSWLCHTLVSKAHAASLDRKSFTPYARDASEHFDMVYSGGKKDDIAVVVVYLEP